MSEYLGDEFDSPTGQFDKYFVIGANNVENGEYDPDAGNSAQAEQLAKQKHTDIRAIQPKTNSVLATMLHMTGLFDMQTMQDMMMSELLSLYLVSVGESWTKGSIRKDPDRNNWTVLSMDCPANQETVSRSTLRR